MPPVVDGTGQGNPIAPSLMNLSSLASHNSSHQQLLIDEYTSLMDEDVEAESHDDAGAWHYSIIILVLACVGLVVNISAIVLISARKQTGIFHRLLKVSDKILHNGVSVLNNNIYMYFM